jgi:hypothetical protein
LLDFPVERVSPTVAEGLKGRSRTAVIEKGQSDVRFPSRVSDEREFNEEVSCDEID